MNPSPKFLILLVVVALILGSAWYYFMQSPSLPAENVAEMAEVSSDNNDNKGIVVTKVDVSEPGESKLPAGFPSDIPVEQANISESYRVVYADRGVTQYTVSYTSLRSRDTLWDSYNDFMKDAGYEADAQLTSKSQGQISGNNEGSSFSAIISNRNGLSFVQISLLNRE